MLIAITRLVSPAIDRCELTHLERIPIDLERARQQHHTYEETLRGLGVEVHSLPEEPDLPDSVFVEDTAIVLDECTLLTRPGVDSRRSEIESIARALAPYRKLFIVQAPCTLDGGDVLTVGRTIFVGLSSRSNQAAIDQMQAFLKPYGYTIKGIQVTGCLHLKSAVTQVGADILLVNPTWVDKVNFPGMKFIEIDPSEQHAANALMVGTTVLYQPVYPKTRARLEAAGIHPVLVDESELGKAEGELTCCALIFTASCLNP
ncbi:MAG: arginine deiminase-related protein [Chloroflexi bacterium]|nr:arginine deiminase-related protein [Chloroflexota bacterium]